MKQCPFGIECDNCRFYWNWNLTNDHGKTTVGQRCGLEVMFDEIPRLKGSIDGLQGGVNEARNRSMETKETVEHRAGQFVNTLKVLVDNVKRIPN